MHPFELIRHGQTLDKINDGPSFKRFCSLSRVQDADNISQYSIIGLFQIDLRLLLHFHFEFEHGDQALDLTSNALQGHIPESLGGLTDLRELWLGCVRIFAYRFKIACVVDHYILRTYRSTHVSRWLLPRVHRRRHICCKMGRHANQRRTTAVNDAVSYMTPGLALWLMAGCNSGNHMVGGIPENLSKLEDLQSLDLPGNKVRASAKSGEVKNHR